MRGRRDRTLALNRRTTVQSYLEDWWTRKTVHGERPLRLTTQRSYRSHLDRFLLPHLGALRLAGGADVAVVSKMLGHSSITLDRTPTAHLIGEVGRQTAEAGAALVPRRARPAG